MIFLPKDPLFVVPPIDVFASDKRTYFGNNPTYGYYNYLRPGLIQRIKRHRFEVALKMASPWFQESKALDFGCADGVLLPSLSKYFSEVVGIDFSVQHLDVARELCQLLSLDNVTLVNNDPSVPPELVKPQLGSGFGVMFLLETMEHIGLQPDVYRARVEFLNSLFRLLDGDGVIIISVPKMVGPTFFAKHVTQKLLRMDHEAYTIPQLLKSAFLRNTDDLEPLWDRGHKGFNHVKFFNHLKDNFAVISTAATLTSELYAIATKRPNLS